MTTYSATRVFDLSNHFQRIFNNQVNNVTNSPDLEEVSSPVEVSVLCYIKVLKKWKLLILSRSNVVYVI